MRRLPIYLLLSLLSLSLSLRAQQTVRAIAFYNLENLFDTIHDEGKNDYEYLPDGGMKWTPLKYEHKLDRMAEAIAALGTDEDPRGAMCVGVAEVENIRCLNDLCARLQEKHERHYEPILLEGPDRRGVDVGFLYNPDLFKPTAVRGYELKAHYTDGGEVRSRLQLLIDGYIKGEKPMEKVHIIVCHWPSRYGGELTSRPTRDTAAMLSMHIIDSLYAREPMAKIILMGDLNDDPYNHSCATVLNAKEKRKQVGEKGLFNTMWVHYSNGNGSLAYNGGWNLFDQIIISEPLLNTDIKSGKWTFWKSQVFNKPFLTVQEGKDKGTPLRTHKGGVWQDGYGDHYPTLIYLLHQHE